MLKRWYPCLLVVAVLACVVAAQQQNVGPLKPNRKVGTSFGGNIAIYQSRGNGLPVFLIHGSSQSSAIFEYLLSNYEFGSRFRVVAMDLPGHGNSDNLADPSNYNLPNLATICREVLNDVGMERAILVGHDVGGQIAIEMAKTLPNLRLLALLSAPALKLPFSANANAFAAGASNPVFASSNLSSDQVKTLAGLLFAPNFRYPDWVESVISRSDANFRTRLSSSLNAGQYTDQYTVLRNTSAPVVLFAGLQDQLINTNTFFGEQAQAIKTVYKEDRDNVGHTPSVENALWISERLAFWIDITIPSAASTTHVSLIVVLVACILALW